MPHVLGELFKTLAGVDLLHVPYRGNPLPELLSGQVQVFFGPIQSEVDQCDRPTCSAAPYSVIDTLILLTVGALASIEACEASVVSF